MTKPMTPERMESIKLHYKMAKAEGASLHHSMVGDCLDEIERLQAAFEEIADPVQYLSLRLNLIKSDLTTQQWAKAVLSNTLRWQTGILVIVDPKALAGKEVG